MATFVDYVNNSSDSVEAYSCSTCERKTLEINAEYFCETCLKFFCQKCLYYHDQLYVNHLTYGRGETNKWPLAKTVEDLLLKCDIHNNKKLKMFCQDHSQLCCSDCVLLNHRQCTNLALISEAVKKLSVDMQQLSNKIQAILAELNKFTRTQEAGIQSVESLYSEKLQEIREQRKQLNAALDKLENTTVKELDELRTTLQTSLKEDIENCSRLKDELKQLGEAVNDLHDKSKKEMGLIASKKCLDKIQESESYLKSKPVKVQNSIIFKANIDIEGYLSKQSSLGRIVDSFQSLTLEMKPNQVLTMKRIFQYNVKISQDTSGNCNIRGICSLPCGQVIVADSSNNRVKMLDNQYNVSSYYDVSSSPWDICLITSIEVAVTLDGGSVQFISVTNGQLVNGRKLQLPHDVFGITHHQGALYITSLTALYHYTLDGTLVKKLYDTGIDNSVYKCAVSPAGDKIFFTNYSQHKLITLATDSNLISTFTDPELKCPEGVHVTPSGQVIVCGKSSHTVIQVDHEGKKKQSTLLSWKDGMTRPLSVSFNTNSHHIIVGLSQDSNINIIELK